MKRWLPLLAALLFSTPAFATGQGIGECLWPNCAQEAGNTSFTPTTAGDWTVYYGTAPTTIQEAFDHLAKKTRAVISQYDVIVDLDQNISFQATGYTTGIDATGAGANSSVVTSWAQNECAQVQNAMNPFLTGAQRQWRVLILGTFGSTWAMMKDQGPLHYCVGLIPANSIGTDGFPAPTVAKQSVGANNNDMLYITWDNVEWQANLCNGACASGGNDQDEPAVLYMTGGGIIFGHDGTGSGGNGTGGLLTNLTQTGNLTIRRMDDNDGSWAQGRPVNTNATTFLESSTSAILYMSYGTVRSDMTGLTMRLYGITGDNDDICFWSSSSWVTSYGRTKLEQCGTGAMWFESNSGTYNTWYFITDDIGMMLGDFVSGGDDPQVSGCLCTGGACDAVSGGSGSNCTTTSTREVSGMQFYNPSIESVNYGMIEFVDVGQEVRFFGLRTEVGSMSSHQIIYGAGQCGNAVGTAMDYRLCAQDTDCDNSGSSICSTASTNQAGVDVGFIGSFLPVDSAATATTWATANCTAIDTPHDCCTGSGAGTNCPNFDGFIVGEAVGNNVTSQLGFVNTNLGYSYDGTDRYPFGISTSTASSNQRARLFVDPSSYWNQNITTIKASKMYDFAATHRYWFESTGEAALDSGDIGKCVPTKGNDTTTGLQTCSTVTTAGSNYPINNGSMFYERGGCMPTAGTNWAAGETVSFGVREVDSAGTLDAALGSAITIPHDTSDDLDASWIWKMETDKDNSAPRQALGLMGATDSAAFRLEMTAQAGLDGNESLSLMCFVDAIRLPILRTQDEGYDY